MTIVVSIGYHVMYVGNGSAGMEAPNAQLLRFAVPMQAVAGGDSPTSAQLATTLTNASALAGTLLTTAQLAQIQGWGSAGT